MWDLKSMLDYAMEITEGGGIRNLSEARRIAYDLYAAHTGNVFPGQQGERMKVNININTDYPGTSEVHEVCEAEAEPPMITAEIPSRRRIVIGKPK